MEKVSITSLNGTGTTLAAHIHFPANFDATQKHAAWWCRTQAAGTKNKQLVCMRKSWPSKA